MFVCSILQKKIDILINLCSSWICESFFDHLPISITNKKQTVFCIGRHQVVAKTQLVGLQSQIQRKLFHVPSARLLFFLHSQTWLVIRLFHLGWSNLERLLVFQIYKYFMLCLYISEDAPKKRENHIKHPRKVATRHDTDHGRKKNFGIDFSLPFQISATITIDLSVSIVLFPPYIGTINFEEAYTFGMCSNSQILQKISTNYIFSPFRWSKMQKHFSVTYVCPFCSIRNGL